MVVAALLRQTLSRRLVPVLMHISTTFNNTFEFDAAIFRSVNYFDKLSYSVFQKVVAMIFANDFHVYCRR